MEYEQKVEWNPARRAATQFHHERHEGHEVLKEPFCVIFLRVLRALRGKKFFSELSHFELWHRRGFTARAAPKNWTGFEWI
jgi:hypothetical protein